MKTLLFYMSVFVLLVMHTAGLYGILYENREEYVNLTGLNLLISFAILVLNFETYSLKLFLFLLFIAVLGFAVELAGVHSQMIFGNYQYSYHLGIRLWGVPLVIGINWALLIFSIGSALQRFRFSIWMKSFIGAGLMIVLDLLLEPVATTLGYWQWQADDIPVQNYIAWGLISFLMFFLCFHFIKKLKNPIGIFIYIIQIVFFSLLNLLL